MRASGIDPSNTPPRQPPPPAMGAHVGAYPQRVPVWMCSQHEPSERPGRSPCGRTSVARSVSAQGSGVPAHCPPGQRSKGCPVRCHHRRYPDRPTTPRLAPGLSGARPAAAPRRRPARSRREPPSRRGVGRAGIGHQGLGGVTPAARYRGVSMACEIQPVDRTLPGLSHLGRWRFRCGFAQAVEQQQVGDPHRPPDGAAPG